MPAAENEILSRERDPAQVGGCHQLSFPAETIDNAKGSQMPLMVSFALPSGVRKAARGFSAADGRAHARCYVSEPGLWFWEAKSLSGRGVASGRFEANASSLPGKLTISKRDGRQFAYSNGDPYLHLGDTCLRLLAPEETSWQSAIDQAAQAGFNKVRVNLPSIAASAACFFDEARRELDLAFWDEAERRLVYAACRHPRLQFQLCLFAKDRSALELYEEGDALTHLAAQYAFERLGSLPNVHWSLASEIDPAKDNAVTLQALSRLGKYAREQAPWTALITCGQARFTPFLFEQERWCSMSSLSSLGQVHGNLARDTRAVSVKPVVLDEDRSEHRHAPLRPRYYFRRLFWGFLLSGGHPTYEGLDTSGDTSGHRSGVHGYYDACHHSRLSGGAHDLLRIQSFFRQSQITLDGWIPDDSIGGNKPLLVKSMRSAAGDQCLLYIANPDAHEGHTGEKGQGFYSDQNAAASDIFTTFNLELPFSSGRARWYSPRAGSWAGDVEITKASTTFLTPEPGDWLLWAQRS